MPLNHVIDLMHKLKCLQSGKTGLGREYQVVCVARIDEALSYCKCEQISIQRPSNEIC